MFPLPRLKYCKYIPDLSAKAFLRRYISYRLHNPLIFSYSFLFALSAHCNKPLMFHMRGRNKNRNMHTFLRNMGYEYIFRAISYSVSSFFCFIYSSSPSLSTAINVSGGTSTEPSFLMRFLPSFCFSRSFFFLVISPP